MRAVYARDAISAFELQNAVIDICSVVEVRLLWRHPELRTTSWHAELIARDEFGLPLTVEWSPGDPVPPGTRLLVCSAFG